MSVTYQEGAKCILKHCHDLHEESKLCRRKFVRSTILSPHSVGIARRFSSINGPVNPSQNFKCNGELASCGCMHSEPQVVLDLVTTVPDIMRKRGYFQYILLCSYSPCTQCANIIINSKVITAVVYDKITEHDLRGEERLRAVMPVLTVRQIEEIAGGSYRGELNFVKRWGNG